MRKLVAIAAFAVVVSACGGGIKESTPASEPPRVINLADDSGKAPDFTSGANPSADIVSAIMGLQREAFWTSKISSPTLKEMDTTLLYAAPDRYHMKSVDSEIIAIGKLSWLKDGQGWVKSDIDFGGAIQGARPRLDAAAASRMKDVKLLRKEDRAGKAVSVYSYTDADIVNTIWIEDGTGRLLQTTAQIEFGGKTHDRTTVFDYETPVRIEAPKVK